MMNLPYRIERLCVEGYRAFLGNFELDFPWPALAGRPDVLVLGSANGVGKTSLLEAILWGGLAVNWGADLPWLAHPSKRPDFPQFATLLRADAAKRQIEMTIALPPITPPESTEDDAEAKLPPGWRRGTVRLTFSKQRLDKVVLTGLDPQAGPGGQTKQLVHHVVKNILRSGSEPVSFPGMLYFSSYRRIFEGNIELKTPQEGSESGRRRHQFKAFVLDLTLWQKGLLPDAGDKSAEMQRAYDVLNGLLRDFAGVVLSGEALLVDGHFHPFVRPERGGTSYPLDNLSSGQKEAIGTLFLIWKFTSQTPAVVLIDEPELYLNREWHRTFVNRLVKLVPHNQYILATHSKEVAGAAPDGTLRMLRRPE